MAEKWSINRLSDETGFDRRSIKKWLTAADKAPCDVDGKTDYYSLRDFIDAVVAKDKPADPGGEGDAFERKATLQGDILEIEKAKLALTVLDTEEVFRVLENRDIAIRQVILGCDLPEETKDKILNDLRTININDILAERSVDSGVTEASQ